MKKFTSILTLITIFAVCAMAQPKIEFNSEVVDYGVIAHKADGNREFVLKNTGNQDLIISTCQGSCGCTVPKCPQEPIAPGESASIKVHYDTNRVGKFTKFVTVNSNAEPASIQLTIKGEILPDPTANPDGTSAPANSTPNK